MQEPTNEYAFGDYGDYSGISLYGPPEKGFWFDRFDVSSRFVNPIFNAVVDCFSGDDLPAIVYQWLTTTGWCIENTMVEVAEGDLRNLIYAISSLTERDLKTKDNLKGPEVYLRCIKDIVTFIESRINKGKSIYIESA